jgi:hypothetical protein
MAHCPYERLADLETLFDDVRAWAGIREPKPGIFYCKSKPFLHFHIKDDARWADVRSAGAWERIDAPAPLAGKRMQAFAKRIKTHHTALIG